MGKYCHGLVLRVLGLVDRLYVLCLVHADSRHVFIVDFLSDISCNLQPYAALESKNCQVGDIYPVILLVGDVCHVNSFVCSHCANRIASPRCLEKFGTA